MKHFWDAAVYTIQSIQFDADQKEEYIEQYMKTQLTQSDKKLIFSAQLILQERYNTFSEAVASLVPCKFMAMQLSAAS